MLYLESFTIPSADMQDSFFYRDGDIRLARTCYTDFYPFRVFNAREPECVAFAPVTVFYGGNGSGKTTLLNVIAEALKVGRGAAYNRSVFFPDYIRLCKYTLGGGSKGRVPEGSRIITSDDVFDFLLDLRCLNENIDTKRDALLSDYTQTKYARFQFRSMEDYDRLRQTNLTRRKSGSQYVKANLMQNLREQSNGESAFMYFTQEVGENGLYLLDEPENSLSAEMQLKLLEFLRDSARFYGCQFIISTHSPFLLSMKDAVIYDLDEAPIRAKKWTELQNVRVYRNFFREHDVEFDIKT
ncbi:Predicted ATPase [Sporobacter termitidis DSM 10068]|uniref:Predicted ATPase n=1 Tax=Sporobacter termitidis DSM 10068 TaxID=1123282 RepID=A0A1M5Z162_9FIRM|nr:AAA family ATPase [Sporobacter termitidis]SHI17986.1 Predicted ATPase [Sporobacter termitidis DSM 10068]